MNMTPASEDLIEDDYGSQQFRNQLLPLWMKILSYLLVFGSVALVAVFVVITVDDGLDAFLSTIRRWQDLFVFILFLNCCLFGLTAWGLLREKRWAVDFGPVNIGIGVLVVAYAAVEIIWMRFKYPDRRLGIDEVIIFIVFLLLCIYLYRLLSIRKEWKLRRSKITGEH